MPIKYELSDQNKNDFQNAKKRNLHTWTQWRMKLNNSLVDAVLTGSQVQDVESFGHYMNHEVPDPYHPTTNPKTLMTYSAAANSATNLRRRYFYKYGIPRVKLSPVRVETVNRQCTRNIPEDQVDFNFSDAEPEELTLDYFDYEDPKERMRIGKPVSVRHPSPNLYSNNSVRTLDYGLKEMSRNDPEKNKINRLIRQNITISAMS